MGRKRDEVLDDDGNVLPVPGPESGDVEKAIYLLEYARLRGFRIGPTLKVGAIVTQVRDLRQEEKMSHDQRDALAPDLVPGSDMALLLGGPEE